MMGGMQSGLENSELLDLIVFMNGKISELLIPLELVRLEGKAMKKLLKVSLMNQILFVMLLPMIVFKKANFIFYDF